MEKLIIKKHINCTFMASHETKPGLNFSFIDIFVEHRKNSTDTIQDKDPLDILGSHQRLWVEQKPVQITDTLWRITVRMFTNRSDEYIEPDLLKEDNELYFPTYDINER